MTRSGWGRVASEPLKAHPRITLAEGVEFDPSSDELYRTGRVFKLERIPAAVLLLLVERQGQVVPREEIVERVWGKNVFLDTDNSINSAIRKIRQVLKDDPEDPRFIQTLTGRGYRLISPVSIPEKLNGEGASKPMASTTVASARDFVSELDSWLLARKLRLVEEDQGRTPKQVPDAERAHELPNRSDRRWLSAGAVALLAVGCALSFLAIWAWQRSSRLSTSSDRKTILAVLPFENVSRDPDQDFFSDGLTEEMIAQVGKLNRDRLSVIARSSVAKYKGSKLAAKDIGRALNADYLLQGSVRRSSDRVRITVQLVQVGNQTDLWTESYDRELKDVLTVQDSVVRSIASQIHIALTEEQEKRFASQRQIKPETYEAYLKGRYYWNRRTGDSMERAEKYFQQAIEGDPTYAEAYSGFADCNSGLSWHGFKSPAEALPKAYEAARKAIEINPQSAEAHASLGLVLSHRWEWAGAEAEFRRALELDPQYANAHHWYGDYLSIRGRHDEALAEARRALKLDPLNLMISTWVGLRYYLAHNYFAAIEQNRNSVEMDSNFAAAHLLLGEDYLQAGLPGEAVSELKSAASLSGYSPLYTAQVAVALATAGRKRDALQIVRQLETMSGKRYVSPYGLAQIYASLNDKEHTFKWLQAAYDDRAVWMGYLGVDPIFDRYRSDQRFQEFLRRIALP